MSPAPHLPLVDIAPLLDAAAQRSALASTAAVIDQACRRFPVGGELTSGVPDRKEGIYFGDEHGPDHPRVVSGTPLHGPNQFPDHPGELRSAVPDHADDSWGVGEHTDYGLLTLLAQDRHGGLQVKALDGSWTDVDPSWDATVPTLPHTSDLPAHDRWDGADVLAWEGTYGDYLTSKVAKVFPQLFDAVTVDASPHPQ